MNIDLPLDRKILLFGYQEQNCNSPLNYIILCVKYFIWKTKLQIQQLSLLALQRFLKIKIQDLKDAFLYEDKAYKFEPFLSVRPRDEDNEAALPNQSFYLMLLWIICPLN